MKIIRMSSELTRNIIPTAASRISAKYSPTCGVKSVSTEMSTVKIVSTSSATLMNWVRGSTTNMPSRKVACCGNASIQAIAAAQPTQEIIAPIEEPEAQLQPAQRHEISRQHDQHGEHHNGFRRGELEQFKVADPTHGVPPFGSQSKSGEPKLCEIRSSSSLG